MERRIVKVYNGQQRINLNKNNSFKESDDVAILHYEDYLAIKDNVSKKELDKIVKDKEDTITKKDSTIKSLNVNSNRLITKNNELLRINNSLKEIIEAKDKVISGANNSNLKLQNKILDLENAIEYKNKTINELLATIEAKDIAVTNANKEVLAKSEEITKTIKDYNTKTEIITNESLHAKTELKIAKKEIDNLREIDVIKSKSYANGLENVILISERALTSDALINNVNKAIANKGRFKRLIGFSLTNEDIGLDKVAKEVTIELTAIKDNLRLK